MIKHKYVGMSLNELDAMISDMNAAKSINVNGERYVNAKELKEIISTHFRVGHANFRKVLKNIYNI